MMKPNSKNPVLIILVMALGFFSTLEASSEKITIFCAGDSITRAQYPQDLKKILRKNGISADVLNHGKSGLSSGQYFNYLISKKARLAEKKPDFVLIQLGTNDVRVDHPHVSAEEYYKNMINIIKLFRTLQNRKGGKPIILLATIPPIPETSPYPWSQNSNKRVVEEINPMVRKICKDEKIPLVDNYSLFLNLPDLLPEVHPLREGYTYIAQNWFNKLRSYLQ